MKATKDAEESNMKSDVKIVKDGISGVGTGKEDRQRGQPTKMLM